MNRFKQLLKWTWAIFAGCIILFFAIALIVYIKIEPENMSEMLSRDRNWLSIENLCATSDNIEKYPYVTKVYQYETNAERLNIKYFKQKDDSDMNYGVVEDALLSCNYRVECFIYNDMADKEVVKQLWDISVYESDGLVLNKNDRFNVAQDATLFYDLKKNYSRTPKYCTTFMRISVKPGINDIGFYNIIQDG